MIYLTLQANSYYTSLFNTTYNNESSDLYYAPRCVYFDTTTQKWSDYGISIVSQDNDTGLVNCSTTHLSQFTLDYIQLSKGLIDPLDPDDTNSTDSIFVSDNKLYVYYIAVSAPSFITLLAVTLSFISKTEWEGGDPDVESMKKKSYSCCSIFCSTLALYHILISAFCGREKANVHLTMPKYQKMIDFWWLLYAILGAMGLTFYYTSGNQNIFWVNLLPDNSTSTDPRVIDWTDQDYFTNSPVAFKYNNLVYLGLFTLGVIIVGRIIVLSLGYLIYFCGKQMSSQSMTVPVKKTTHEDEIFGISDKDQMTDRGTDLEDNHMRRPKPKKGKKKKKKSRARQLREQHNIEMEGGSSEDEDLISKPKSSANRRQHRSRGGAGNSKERRLLSSNRGEDQDNIGMKRSGNGKPKSNRYDEYEQNQYAPNRSSNKQEQTNEYKNIADIIDQINESAAMPKTNRKA